MRGVPSAALGMMIVVVSAPSERLSASAPLSRARSPVLESVAVCNSLTTSLSALTRSCITVVIWVAGLLKLICVGAPLLVPVSVRVTPGMASVTVLPVVLDRQAIDLDAGVAGGGQQAVGRAGGRPGQIGQAFLADRFGRFQGEAVGGAFRALQHQLGAVGGVGDIGGDAGVLGVDRAGDIGQRGAGGHGDVHRCMGGVLGGKDVPATVPERALSVPAPTVLVAAA